MKKTFLYIFAALFFIILIFPVLASATEYKPDQGLVPCGNSVCDSEGKNCVIPHPCTICDFFTMLARIYDFLVKWIATPLAILGITIGAVMLMISAGNPNLASTGKKVLWAAIIGLVLVFLSWLIINTILSTLGFNLGSWWNPNLSCQKSPGD